LRSGINLSMERKKERKMKGKKEKER